MFLKTKDGIKCDMCKKEIKSKFIYYSYDCHKISVDTQKLETKEITNVDGSIISFDICEECHKTNIDKMLED